MRILLDPNVLVAAMLSATGAPALLVKAWRDNRVEVVVSPRLLDEVAEVLARPRIARLIDARQRTALLADLRARATVVEDPEPTRAWTRDPKDDYLVELGIHARAIMLTGDKDLLEASVPVPALTPRAFLDRLDRSAPP